MEQVHHSFRARASSASSAWLPYGDPDPAADIRLFCFYYAGGNTTVFRNWSSLLPPEIHVCPVELPGHGARMQEAPMRCMSEVVEGLEQELAAWLRMPFAFFGHSMGATIAFELTRRAQARLGVKPQCLFLSGRRAPGRPEPAPIHALPEPQFVEEIRRLSGTPEELLAHPEIRALLVPLLRADFALIEECASADRSQLDYPILDCPIVGLGGLEDPRAGLEDVLAWREITSGSFSLEMLAGDHFFLNRSRARLLQIIASHLITGVRAPGSNFEASARACGMER